MRDNFQTRLPELKVRRVNDTCYVDTFFSSIPSIRGFNCWNLFAFKRTGMDAVYLLHRRSQSPTTLPKLVTDFGAPRTIKSDNAPEFKGKRWITFLNSMAISSVYTEAHHPNQNLAERRGGALKAGTIHLLKVTGAPLKFWCYALEYMCLLRNVSARRSLDWSTPHERHWGDRPDISVFRFVFWEPIWYYQPRQSFPRPKMLKGRFLGIAQNIGDAFCFLIYTEPELDSTGACPTPQVLARSVIRRRFPRDSSQEEHAESAAHLTFYLNDERTPMVDPPATSTTEDALEDIISPVDQIQVDTNPTDSVEDSDSFEDGLIEVYGPSAKRHRSLECDTGHGSPLQTVRGSSPLPLAIAEEPDVLPPTASTHTASDAICQRTSNAVAETQSNAFESVPVAATPGVDHTGDDSDGGDNAFPMDDGIGNFVTQDEEVTPALLDSLAQHLTSVAEDDSDVDALDGVVGHEWIDGILMLQLKWKTNETSLVPFSLAQRDYAGQTAEYILQNKLGCPGSKYTNGRFSRWARQYTRLHRKVIRRLIRLSGGAAPTQLTSRPTIPTNLPDGTRLVRRVATAVSKTGGKRKSKPGRLSRPVQIKYGVQVPQTVKQAYELDKINGNTLWADAIKKEVDTLLAMKCFAFHSPDYKPSSDFQFAKLSMILEVKQDGRRKARLVAGGHTVDPMGVNSRSTVVKGISVRLLDLIAHRDNLQVLCGDIGNAFITADCMEKIYSRAGPEFGDREGSILVFQKALYGLRSSSRAFRTHFADFLRSLGFFATRYDRDVWMRLRDDKSGYDYVCTHVDDFKIVARDPDRWKTQIAAAFLLKSVGPPSYYLGNDYNFSVQENAWVISCGTYIKECIRRIEGEMNILDGTLWPHRTPLPEGCHPELDDSEMLSDDGIRTFQTLIGMAQWASTIGRLDIAFAVSSLSRFSAAPRTYHLELAVHLFGYLKKNPNRRIVVDSRPLLVDDELKSDSFHPDFLEDYPDAREDIDDGLPAPHGAELMTSVFFDADHAHDQVTRRSISGIIVFVGSTPVLWQSKRQGCIATSTYCAEFISMRTAVEEAISIRYMLRCLGVPVTVPTDLFGDNFGVIQSAEIPDGELKKKHIAISYHYVREAIAARIVNAHWCKSHENFADLCTKSLGTNLFTSLVTDLMA